MKKLLLFMLFITGIVWETRLMSRIIYAPLTSGEKYRITQGSPKPESYREYRPDEGRATDDPPIGGPGEEFKK